MKFNKLSLRISSFLFIYISRVQLVHDHPLHGVQAAHAFPTGPTVTAGHHVIKHLIACTAKDREAVEPSHVWIKGKMEKNVVAEDGDGDEHECKGLASGYEKINQMAQK